MTIDRKKAKAILDEFGSAALGMVPIKDRPSMSDEDFGRVMAAVRIAVGGKTGAPCAMPHTAKRKKYDQERTPWKRLGPREAEILDAGWRHVQSVPYKVSSRWLFYRLLQDGFYKGKDDYKNNFTKLFSRARHTGQGSWAPDSLEDEGRSVIIHAGGCRDEAAAIDEMKANVLEAAYVPLNH